MPRPLGATHPLDFFLIYPYFENSNFKKKYTINNVEKLECSLGCPEIENQQHILACKPLLSELKDTQSNISYNDIFSNTKKQNAAVKHYVRLLVIRNELLQED